MSDLSRFLKKNKKERQNVTYAATKSLTDEKGQPLLWTLRPISTKENDALRDACTVDVPVTGKQACSGRSFRLQSIWPDCWRRP